MLGNPDRRIRWILLCFTLVFCAIAARATLLQTVQADKYSALANEQHVQLIEFPARRGSILDRAGNELAVGEEKKSIYATPYLVEDPLTTSQDIAPLLNMDPNSILAKLSQQDTGFVYIARKIDPDIAGQIEDMGITGLGFMTEEQRNYPQKELAAQVIGYAGVDNIGLAGVELEMDETLAGTGGRQRVVTDAGGKEIEMLSLEEGTRGTDIWLTIDQAIQYETEKILTEAVEEWDAERASAIVMNPRNGDIYAMANVPAVDANKFDDLSAEERRNRAVTDVYEPGSVFKAVTAIAGLEEGAVAPGQKMYLPPTLELGGKTIQDAYDRGPVSWDLETILEHSSNIGAVTVGMQVGKERLDYWIRRMGFGQPTGIDYPGEAEGIVIPPAAWSGSTIGNVPIGQGISVTALQMATAYATIANSGVSVKPRLVYGIGDEELPPEEGERLVSEATCGYLKEYLSTVVDGEGAPLARIEGYSVAGKTGTAQKPLPDGSGYSEEDYIGSFIGFVPAGDPQLLVLVMVDEPKPAGVGGSTVAAPTFQKIAQFALQKLRIAP